LVTAQLIIEGVISGLLLGGLYAVMSSGLSLYFGVTRAANSAHAAFAIVGAYTAYWFFTLYGVDPLLSLPLTFAILFAIGLLLEKSIMSKVVEAPMLTPMVLTLFLAIAIENLMVLFWTSDYRFLNVSFAVSTIVLDGLYIPITGLIAFIAALISMLGLILMLQFTRFGKAVRAVAQNREAAKICGIRVQYVYMITCGISLGLASVGGVLMSMVYTFYPALQELWIGKLFAIIIFGGWGSVTGTLVAALIIGMVESISGLFVPAILAQMSSWVVLLLTLLVRPQGLLGKYQQ
jgi:branched-chain amino acid transport system permease protein